MKTLLAIAAALAISASAAQADGPVSGRELFEGCTVPLPVRPPPVDKTKKLTAAQMIDGSLALAKYNREMQPLIMCHNYILGVADGIGAFAHLYGVKDCVPDGVMASDMKDVFINYYRAHPESRQLGAQRMVTAAFVDAWSCRFDNSKDKS